LVRGQNHFRLVESSVAVSMAPSMKWVFVGFCLAGEAAGARIVKEREDEGTTRLILGGEYATTKKGLNTCPIGTSKLTRSQCSRAFGSGTDFHVEYNKERPGGCYAASEFYNTHKYGHLYESRYNFRKGVGNKELPLICKAPYGYVRHGAQTCGSSIKMTEAQCRTATNLTGAKAYETVDSDELPGGCYASSRGCGDEGIFQPDKPGPWIPTSERLCLKFNKNEGGRATGGYHHFLLCHGDSDNF